MLDLLNKLAALGADTSMAAHTPLSLATSPANLEDATARTLVHTSAQCFLVRRDTPATATLTLATMAAENYLWCTVCSVRTPEVVMAYARVAHQVLSWRDELTAHLRSAASPSLTGASAARIWDWSTAFINQARLPLQPHHVLASRGSDPTLRLAAAQLHNWATEAFADEVAELRATLQRRFPDLCSAHRDIRDAVVERVLGSSKHLTDLGVDKRNYPAVYQALPTTKERTNLLGDLAKTAAESYLRGLPRTDQLRAVTDRAAAQAARLTLPTVRTAAVRTELVAFGEVCIDALELADARANMTPLLYRAKLTELSGAMWQHVRCRTDGLYGWAVIPRLLAPGHGGVDSETLTRWGVCEPGDTPETWDLAAQLLSNQPGGADAMFSTATRARRREALDLARSVKS